MNKAEFQIPPSTKLNSNTYLFLCSSNQTQIYLHLLFHHGISRDPKLTAINLLLCLVCPSDDRVSFTPFDHRKLRNFQGSASRQIFPGKIINSRRISSPDNSLLGGRARNRWSSVRTGRDIRSVWTSEGRGSVDVGRRRRRPSTGWKQRITRRENRLTRLAIDPMGNLSCPLLTRRANKGSLGLSTGLNISGQFTSFDLLSSPVPRPPPAPSFRLPVSSLLLLALLFPSERRRPRRDFSAERPIVSAAGERKRGDARKGESRSRSLLEMLLRVGSPPLLFLISDQPDFLSAPRTSPFSFSFFLLSSFLACCLSQFKD